MLTVLAALWCSVGGNAETDGTRHPQRSASHWPQFALMGLYA